MCLRKRFCRGCRCSGLERCRPVGAIFRVAARGWLSSGGSGRAGLAPFPQRGPGGSVVRDPGFYRAGVQSRLAPGVTPSLSRALPSPEAAWMARRGRCPSSATSRGRSGTSAGRDRETGTEGQGDPQRTAGPGRVTGRVRALFPCMGSQPCCCSCPFSHLLVGV